MIAILSIVLCLLSLGVCGLAWWLRAVTATVRELRDQMDARLDLMEHVSGVLKQEDRDT